MHAEEALKSGDLDGALADLTEQVRRAPADPRLRIFLFQLLAVLGQWNRALVQLNVVGELDAGALAMVNTYRDALSCEALRAAVFAGERDPLVLGEPAEWVALLLQGHKLAAQDRASEAADLRERAFAAAPATPGQIDGEPFAWIVDADGRLGPMLEAIVNGRYYWVPFAHMRLLQFEEPQDLRDLVWAPAHITWSNGGETVAFVPSRYPGSESSTDGRIQLARLTDWVDQGEGLFTGIGQRMLTTDAGDYALLATRRIEIDQPQDGAS